MATTMLDVPDDGIKDRMIQFARHLRVLYMAVHGADDGESHWPLEPIIFAINDIEDEFKVIQERVERVLRAREAR